MAKLDGYAREMAAMKNITCRTGCCILTEIRFSMEERRNIYLMLKGCINNAVKYSNCTLPKPTVIDEGGHLIFPISDNGRGFDQNSSQKGNGLLFMNCRAKDLHAQLLIESALNRALRYNSF